MAHKESRPPTKILIEESWRTIIMEPSIMGLYQVRNVSDTRVVHTSCVFLSICHLPICRVHFNVVVFV